MVAYVAEAVALHAEALDARAVGHGAEASDKCARALDLLERACAHPSADVANVLIALGQIRQDAADYPGAEAAFASAREILDLIEGDDEVLVRLRAGAIGALAGLLRDGSDGTRTRDLRRDRP